MSDRLFAAKSLPRFGDDDGEHDEGSVHSISGPIITAEGLVGAALFELVKIGPKELLGEIVQWKEGISIIQVFEETGGLKGGDRVIRLRKPLSVELGPGLLTSFFDGLQRPFRDIKEVSGSNYLPRGISVPALDREKQWLFDRQKVMVGDVVTGGDIYGKVQETNLVTHWLMVPPNIKGTVTFIAPDGNYTITDVMLEVEFQGNKKKGDDVARMARSKTSSDRRSTSNI
eukprot:TRINITY_DN5247_c0_g1_i9.p1 TRINITY_DN5247_c0_g1~~TRINITY_DN5247_c0_g1_i9.p1  ORF type:complete len:229 (-),score=45.37 TRINITY_DN5247_c0_g1_i9:398-1084(-)